jgi:hypothetical protein
VIIDDMADEERVVDEDPSAEEDHADPEPFFRRCDELSEQWDGLQERSQHSGNRSNTAEVTVRIAGFVFAAAAAGVSTLVAAKVKGDLLTSTTAAILAGLATIATGIQASGMFRNRAMHHYERVDVYRNVRAKARTVKSQVESKTITVAEGYQELHKLIDQASTRPAMP